jgi:hypothetical protein
MSHIQRTIVRLVAIRFGVAVEILQLIGYGTLLWSSIELELQELIAELAGWPHDTAHLVTADMQNLSRLQLARNLLNSSPVTPDVAVHVETLLRLFDQARITRNAIVHGIPVTKDTDDREGLTVRFEARQGDGKIKAKELILTRAFMSNFINACEILSLSLRHTQTLIERDRRYRRSKKLRGAHSASDFVWQGTGRGPETGALIAALELLRLPPQTQKDPRKNR